MIQYDKNMKLNLSKGIEQVAFEVIKKRAPGRYRFCVSVDPSAGTTFRQLCDGHQLPVSRVIEYLIQQFIAAASEKKK